MKVVYIKETERTRSLCIAGCKGYVEREHEAGMVSVCVYGPFDGRLCGPFLISRDEIESETKERHEQIGHSTHRYRANSLWGSGIVYGVEVRKSC